MPQPSNRQKNRAKHIGSPARVRDSKAKSNARKKSPPKATTVDPIDRLLAQIRAIERSKVWLRTPSGTRLAPVLAEFRQRLLDAVDEPAKQQLAAASATPEHSSNRTLTGDAGRKEDDERGSAAAPATKAESKPDVTTEAVRIYTLDRVSGAVARQLVVHEQIDGTLDPEDVEYRVACRELTDDESLTWVDAGLEGSAIRIFFPDDQFYGFPPFLDLEKPRRPQVGQTWRLFRPDRVPAATFILKAIDETERRRPDWKHGDIVRALYDGKQYVARFIRTTGAGLALVHWEVDETFSEIPFEHVIGPTKKQRWSRGLEPEDVEVEF